MCIRDRVDVAGGGALVGEGIFGGETEGFSPGAQSVQFVGGVVALHDPAFARHGNAALAPVSPAGGDGQVARVGVERSTPGTRDGPDGADLRPDGARGDPRD